MEHWGREHENIVRTSDSVSSSNVRSYIHKASAAWLPKDELRKDNNGLVKVDGGKHTSIQSYTKYFRQLGEAK